MPDRHDGHASIKWTEKRGLVSGFLEFEVGWREAV